jgi:uroporphyrinogen-III synthase
MADGAGGRPVLLTRPLEDSRVFADRLAEEGVESLIWPLTRIVPAGGELALPPGTDALLVTSAHGIRAFAALRRERALPVLAVGRKTAEVARGLGFHNVLSADADAEALAAMARASAYRRFFHPRGRDVAADLPALIGGPARAVTEAVLYRAEETGPPPAPVADALARGRVGAVTIWSRRNAEILAAHLSAGRARLGPGIALVAISRSAAEPLKDAGFSAARVSDEPTAAGMHAAIVSHPDR